MTDILKQDLQDSVLEITINREDAGNALSNEVIGLLNDSLMQHKDRSDLKCVLIRGSGEKFFVAGGDLKELTSVRKDRETEAMALNGTTCNSPAGHRSIYKRSSLDNYYSISHDTYLSLCFVLEIRQNSEPIM